MTVPEFRPYGHNKAGEWDAEAVPVPPGKNYPVVVGAGAPGTPPAARKRSWGPMLLVLAGLAAIIIALAIGTQRYGTPAASFSLSQANGLCASTFGQYAQITSLKANANCSSVATAEHARGWLWIGGVAGLVAAFAWGLYDQKVRA